MLDLSWYRFFLCVCNLTEQWESPCFQTLKQYQVAGLGMLLIFILLFLSTHYLSRRVITNWKNIKLLDLVWYWYFFSFFVTLLSETPCYQNLKQYQVAWLGLRLTFLCILNRTEQWELPRYQTLNIRAFQMKWYPKNAVGQFWLRVILSRFKVLLKVPNDRQWKRLHQWKNQFSSGN